MMWKEVNSAVCYNIKNGNPTEEKKQPIWEWHQIGIRVEMAGDMNFMNKISKQSSKYSS